ncbi:hypothetical protein [Pontibacter virosus]|nr:hypothetical protein [Pontibacter virosus]
MTPACQLEPGNKKAYAKELRTILVKEHGKKVYYKPEEVKQVHWL